MIILAELTCHKIVGYFWHEGKVSLAENARLTNQVLVLRMQRGQMLANGRSSRATLILNCIPVHVRV